MTEKSPGKRFNNGHKTFLSAENSFMNEIYTRESNHRDRFQGSMHMLKKPRNPCLGELTARDQAEYLVPKKIELNDNIDYKAMRNHLPAFDVACKDRSKLIAGLSQVDSLQRRKEVIQNELEVMQRVLEHKRLCLILTRGHKPDPLHPAFETIS